VALSEGGGVSGTDEAFGFHVRRLRLERGWSYRDLSARCGAAYSLLWRAEHGTGVTLRHAVAIAGALEVPLPLLLDPVSCMTCTGSPPPGFICQDCGVYGPLKWNPDLGPEIQDQQRREEDR